MLPYNVDKKCKYCKTKLIIFDEADNMTDKALPIISMIMDKYYKTTRFVFTCNTSAKIIESIQSRCKILRFPRLETIYVIKRLGEIAKIESIKFTTKGLEEIAITTNGDLRSAINLLQLTYDKYKDISSDTVAKACDKPPAFLIKEIIVACMKKDLKTALIKTFDLKAKGMTGLDIIYNSFNIMKLSICDDITDTNKMKLLTVISNYMYELSNNMDTDVLLTSYLIELHKAT
jgi:replication factor C subunit 2/4